MTAEPRAIGILDLQGGVAEHVDHLQALGVAAVRVKEAEQLEDLAGLIIPGGESTCLGKLLKIFRLDQVVIRRFGEGMKVWGTCAGAILVAKTIVGESSHLGLIDIAIHRNAFGSQLDSFQRQADVPAVSPHPIPLTFIRAPQIESVGPGVRVLLRMDSYIAAAESDDVIATVFHPELSPSLAFHRYFAVKCGVLPRVAATEETVRDWSRKSWMKHARITAPAGRS